MCLHDHPCSFFPFFPLCMLIWLYEISSFLLEKLNKNFSISFLRKNKQSAFYQWAILGKWAWMGKEDSAERKWLHGNWCHHGSLKPCSPKKLGLLYNRKASTKRIINDTLRCQVAAWNLYSPPFIPNIVFDHMWKSLKRDISCSARLLTPGNRCL